MKNNKKGFANMVLIGVVVLAMVGYVIFLNSLPCGDSRSPLSPFISCAKPEVVQNETSNWKTYTNTQYGFEVKYPDKSKLYFTSNPFSVSVNAINVDLFPIPYPSNYFDVIVYKNETAIEKELEKNKTQKTRTIDGKIFNQSMGVERDLDCNGSYFYKQTDYIYVIAYGENDCNGEAYEKILSTFKFTK